MLFKSIRMEYLSIVVLGIIIGIVVPLAYFALQQKQPDLISKTVIYFEELASDGKGEIVTSKWWIVQITGGCLTCTSGQFALFVIPLIVNDVGYTSIGILSCLAILYALNIVLFANRIVALVIALLFVGSFCYFNGLSTMLSYLVSLLSSVALAYQVERRLL